MNSILLALQTVPVCLILPKNQLQTILVKEFIYPQGQFVQKTLIVQQITIVITIPYAHTDQIKGIIVQIFISAKKTQFAIKEFVLKNSVCLIIVLLTVNTPVRLEWFLKENARKTKKLMENYLKSAKQTVIAQSQMEKMGLVPVD